MKTHRALRLFALAGLGPLLALPAAAQDSYAYGGLSVGKTRTNLDEQGISTSLLPAGVTTSGITTSPKDTGYKVMLGYQLNRYLAFEVGYFNLGQFEYNATTAPAGTLAGQVRVQGANADVVGLLPITDNFSALARVGTNYARTRDNFNGTGAAASATRNPSYRHGNYKVGVGLQYAFAPWIIGRLEGERYRVNDAVGHNINANMYSVGLVFPFGRSSAPAPRAMAPVYAPMAAAPPPPPPPAVEVAKVAAPVVAFAPPVAPVPVPRQRVSFSAESMFGFDKATLRAEGMMALDTFVSELRGTTFDSVTVEGHTDRLGTQKYNQQLSQQRAEAVKTYLVEAGRLDPMKVVAVGKSETSPVTKALDCRGTKVNARLVACLQPDRRVEIEVSGTR